MSVVPGGPWPLMIPPPDAMGPFPAAVLPLTSDLLRVMGPVIDDASAADVAGCVVVDLAVADDRFATVGDAARGERGSVSRSDRRGVTVHFASVEHQVAARRKAAVAAGDSATIGGGVAVHLAAVEGD